MMKKAWAVLLAVTMLISSVSALAEGDPQDTSAAYSAGSGRMAHVAFESDATFSEQKNCFVLDDGKGEFTIEDGVLTVTGGQVALMTKPDSGASTRLALGQGASFSYDSSKQTVTLGGGEAAVSTEALSNDRIAVSEDMTLTLDGVNISAVTGPAVYVEPGYTLRLFLAEGSSNTVTGGNGYAGIGVGYHGIENQESTLATLIIDGSGSITCSGSGEGAGIGGSDSFPDAGRAKHGNIVINGGTVRANGAGRSAGIGSSNNYRNDNKPSASYKPYNNQPDWGTIEINGGDVTAAGVWNGAGIGGGNHNDSGKIVINGGNIEASGDSGIGSGLGSSTGDGKGPGYFYADVTIKGGYVRAHATNSMGAGIGGGMYSDAYVTITGGTVIADVTLEGKAYQGGSGIGGGYQGEAVVRITGGQITATGGNGSAGIGNGALGAVTVKNGNGTKKVRAWNPTIKDSEVYISGGNIKAYGGIHGAGIGSGNAGDVSKVTIEGGTVLAVGGKSSEEAKEGAAGIGSGTYYSSNKPEYRQETVVSVSISAGTVTAIGGWGAAGIGSGALNQMASSVSITGGDVQAYADGTKFAIDTRVLNEDGTTTSSTDGRIVTVPLLQGTFVHSYSDGGVTQNPEGLSSIQLRKTESDAADRTLTGMPAGYRSFAATVSSAGVYDVYTDAASIGEGGGRYFAQALKEVYNRGELDGMIQYTVTGSSLSDNFYLYPVKSFVVEKTMTAEDGADLSGINATAYFNLVHRDTGAIEKIGSIRIVNGVPEGRLYFVNVPDGDYEVWETDAEGNSPIGQTFGGYELKRVTTSDSHAGTSNNGAITEDQWTDRVTVNNFYGVPSVDLTVTKIWEDNGNQDGIRPASVTVQLYADGAAVSGRTLTLSAANNWTGAFEKVPPTNASGSRIVYTVRENAVAGYSAAYGGSGLALTVTNTHTPEVRTISGTKTWEDADNQDGLRPADITVRLLADGTEVRRAAVNAQTGWAYSFADLPVYAGGRQIAYTVTEDEIAGYTSALEGFSLINTHIPETIDIPVAKVWNDNSNQDGVRPASVTVNLLADGVQVRTRVMTGTGNRWTYTFEGLPRFAAGREIVYTLTENPVNGYTAAIAGGAANGFTVTNTHTPEVITISGRKTWNDGNNADGIRPGSITVRLLADGRTAETRTVRDGTWTFRNLPRYVNGREIVYTLSEDPVAGYTTEISGYDITNTHVPLRVSVEGSKVWADNNDAEGLRPASVRVNLLADGRTVQSLDVTGTGNRWAYSFTDLPGYANGRLITYTVTEDPVESYETTVVGTEIYNIRRIPETEPRRYTLTIRYWVDGRTAFPDFRATHLFGDAYNVVSPSMPGYSVDRAVVSGIIVEDTVIDVYYTANPLHLTIFYQYMDGSIAADTYEATLMPGDAYDVVSPEIEGYTATLARVSGVMPNRDEQFVVVYLPAEGERDPETQRVRITGGFLLIDDYGTPLGLGEVNRNAGETIE